MNTFNPMTYFKSGSSVSDEDLPDATAATATAATAPATAAPVEYIIRTRSQKALASASAASSASASEGEEQEQSLPSGQEQEQEQTQEEQSQEQSLPSGQEQEQTQEQEQSQEQEQTQEQGLSPKRRAAAASYKSIIRTRSQKLAEQRAFMAKMFADIDAFYQLHKREPTASSASSGEEQAMASFLKSLRDANEAGNLGGQSAVDTVHAHLPWFNFATPPAVTWWNRTMVVRLRINMASIFTLCSYLILMVSFVHTWERCNKDKCPEWLLDAGDALSTLETRLLTASATFTKELTSLWSHTR